MMSGSVYKVQIHGDKNYDIKQTAQTLNFKKDGNMQLSIFKKIKHEPTPSMCLLLALSKYPG